MRSASLRQRIGFALRDQNDTFFFFSCIALSAHFYDIHKHHQVSFKTALLEMSFSPEK